MKNLQKKLTEKTYRKNFLLIPFILLFFLMGCQKEDEFIEISSSTNLLEDTKNYGDSKEIYYQGFLVNHRFSATEEDLKEEHTLEYLKILYNKLRNTTAKGTQAKTQQIEEELPGPNAILEASKVVLVNFPYEKIENYNSVGLEDENSLNVDMVIFDFDNFTDEDIQPNNQVIDEYYSQNLDYMVLLEIANNPTIYDHLDNKHSTLSKTNNETIIALCTILSASASGFGWVRASISYHLAGSRSVEWSSDQYPNLPNGDSRRDAYRHILWNSLLAQYYFTVSSKMSRLSFAKLVTDAREIGLCSNTNAVDSRQMDLHNNFIGREIWNDNTTYRKLFGWIVGLRKPSKTDLKNYAFNKVEKQSCYIVAKRFLIESIKNLNFTELEVKNKILEQNNNLAVYIRGPIAAKRYNTQTTYDYSNCSNQEFSYLDLETGINDSNSNNNDLVENVNPLIDIVVDLDCPVVNTTTIIINACFISKDANFNPY